MFIPIGGQVSPSCYPHSPVSPTPLSTSSCPGLFVTPLPHSHQSSAHSSNTSTPSPPSTGLLYSTPNSRPAPQPITFTTASFAATKFGSTKMKKCGNTGVASSVFWASPRPRTEDDHALPSTISPPWLVKHKPLSLSMHSLAGPIPSQLSPNAKSLCFLLPRGPLL